MKYPSDIDKCHNIIDNLHRQISSHDYAKTAIYTMVRIIDNNIHDLRVKYKQLSNNKIIDINISDSALQDINDLDSIYNKFIETYNKLTPHL